MPTASPADRPAKAPSLPAGRAALRPRAVQHASRVTNGSSTLPGVDGRSAVARRYHDICAAIASDQGGVEHMTEARLQLVRRFAAAAVLAEQMEAKLARGEADRHRRARASVVDALSVGAADRHNRRACDITPTLTEYLAQRESRSRRTQMTGGQASDPPRADHRHRPGAARPSSARRGDR